MVTASIIKNSNEYVSFKCEGHSGFAETGSDIVCAAISMVTLNTANSIMTLTNTVIEPKDNDGYLSWDFCNGIDEKAILLMDSMVLGLKTIEDTYSRRYLTLDIKEV